jgi:hypothetical protein
MEEKMNSHYLRGNVKKTKERIRFGEKYCVVKFYHIGGIELYDKTVEENTPGIGFYAHEVIITRHVLTSEPIASVLMDGDQDPYMCDVPMAALFTEGKVPKTVEDLPRIDHYTLEHSWSHEEEEGED